MPTQNAMSPAAASEKYATRPTITLSVFKVIDSVINGIPSPPYFDSHVARAASNRIRLPGEKEVSNESVTSGAGPPPMSGLPMPAGPMNRLAWGRSENGTENGWPSGDSAAAAGPATKARQAHGTVMIARMAPPNGEGANGRAGGSARPIRARAPSAARPAGAAGSA